MSESNCKFRMSTSFTLKSAKKKCQRSMMKNDYYTYICIYIYTYVKWRNLFVMFCSPGPWTLPWVETWCLTEVVMGSPYPVEHAAPEAKTTNFCCGEWVESGSWWKMIHVLKFMEFLVPNALQCESNNFFRGDKNQGTVPCQLAGDWHLSSAHSNTGHQGHTGAVPVMECKFTGGLKKGISCSSDFLVRNVWRQIR